LAVRAARQDHRHHPLQLVEAAVDLRVNAKCAPHRGDKGVVRRIADYFGNTGMPFLEGAVEMIAEL
jgi:hypothetical protein